MRQVWMNEDEDAFGALDIAQPHLAELLQTRSRGQAILRQLLDCLGKQDLTTPCHAEQTRQPVERRGKVVAFPRFGLTGVDRHTGAQWSELVRPGLCQKHALCRQGGRESGGSRRKGGLRSIADGFEEDSAVGADCFAQE